MFEPVQLHVNIVQIALQSKMIEIKAKLLRNQSAVFLCGETVEVFITFSNHSLPEHKISQSNV